MAQEAKQDNSGGLFDYLRTKHKLNNDKKLGELLDTSPAVISQIRNGEREIREVLLVRICLRTNMTLKKVQTLIAYRAK